MHPRVAGESREGRVQPSVAVDEQDVGSPLQPSHGRLDWREFSKCEIRGNVREVDSELRDNDFLRVERLRIATNRRREGRVAFVGHVDRSHGVHFLDDIRFRDSLGHASLLPPKGLEKSHGGECIEDDGVPGGRRRTQLPQDWSYVCTDHPGRARHVRMVEYPRGHRPRGAHIPQRSCDCAARRHASLRDVSQDPLEGLLEAVSHGRWKGVLPQNLSRQVRIDRPPMSLLLRDGLVVTQDPQRRIVPGSVLVEEGKIAAVGAVDRAADEVIDCAGCAILPGLINTHNHVANTLLRGVADDVPLEQMLQKTFAVDAKFTRRDVQIGALLASVEMIRSGTTSFHDLFYWEDEVARAVRESGIRGFLSWVTLDEAFTTQHGSPLRNAEYFVAKHKGDPLVTPSVGVQGVYVASEETYRKAREIAERTNVRLHTHLSETRKEVYDHQGKTGLRPAEWLESIGFLNERLTAAHGVWLSLQEVRTLSRHGVSVAHCPTSNMKLASGGVAPLPEMFREGVTVALGTDSPVSNNGMDLFAEMKTASLLQKASRWDARVLPAQKALDLATIDAARALGMEKEIGSIEIGKRADLAVVSLRRAHTTPFYPANAISHLVYSCRGSDVTATIVDGVVLMDGGVVRTVDEAEVIARAQETAHELLGA